MNNRSIALLSILLSIFSTILPESCPQTGHPEKSPLLVVLIMVKNEESVIEKTLESYMHSGVKDGPDTKEVAYILYDTGSTDTTIEKTEAIFKKYGLKHAMIVKDGWVDFATSRNRALEIARSTYPQSTFILFPDAEWYLHTMDQLLDFCKKEKAAYDSGQCLPPPYYRLRMMKPDIYIAQTGRLFLTSDDVHFDPNVKVHECQTKCSGASTPSSIYIELGRSKEGYEKSSARWHRDRERQFKEFTENPKNSRNLFYLAKTEKWLGHIREAYTFFKLRKDLPTFPEEDYENIYELATVTDMLSQEDPATYTWQEALSYYIEAYNMRPHRAEPLVRIARHYFEEQQYMLSYIFAKRATELPIPEPEKEILPINLWILEFEQWEVLGMVAWYVQEYEIGEAAMQKAIEAHPNEAYLYKNLSYYWERKNDMGEVR